jgi:hypothetical protein
MRVLSKKQKNFIDKWFDDNWTGAGSLYSVDQMSQDEQEQLEAMNDHETLWQNADRYIGDKATAKVYG